MSLFHYTDANAVLSMMQKKELWLTDIRFMNDSSEASDGAQYLVDAIKLLSPHPHRLNDEALHHLSQFTLEDVLDGLNDQQAFICSFSRIADHLVQWRSYGSYAIEFDDSLAQDRPPISPCIYDVGAKRSEALRLVTETREDIDTELQRGDDATDYDVMRHIWSLSDAANLFKHPSFLEENEMRMIRLQLAPSENIKYRVRGDYVIPYLVVNFELKHVKAIHVGPMKHQELAVSSLKSLIAKIRTEAYGHDPFAPKIEVVASQIPYRQL
ncbi:DUF2971 domain-containing protein [Pseudomonas sp. V1]|uniref:DUF2971 domain-containing protein n=1 Tax=Pseudomonas arcuscaelestis TaxID=2710591 RepID=UPI00193F855A|nr:DUF2971 domain-containing protein [Pseudomonas arcuscaelestis]MBM3108866.1 DUF2971 domain-containing protein [Pseudomonas arcuscaelestis]